MNEAYDEVKTKFMEICPEMSNVLPTKKSLQSLCIRRKSNSKRGEDEMDFNQDDVTENGRGGLIKRTHLEARLRLTQSQDSNNLFDNQLQTHVSSSSSSSMGGPNQDISNAMPNWLIKSIDAAINNVTKPLVERVRILEQRVQLLERVQSGPPASEATTTTSSSNDGVAVVEKRHKFSTAAK